ncbi:MAG TPA: DMT family transporter, partial [Anaerolineales bacterium]|nr:DMT family transporter [Anaerolineales bacterium]
SSSFLWIKIGVQEVGPMSLVAFRMLFGALTPGVIAYFQGIPFSRDWKDWGIFAIFGPLSLAIPVFLISWGEQTIDSAVASILNATVPLFTLIIAHFWISDDRITFQKTLGLLIGFAGVVILMSKDLIASQHASIIGQVAVILASLFYGLSAVGIRKYTTHINNVMRGVGLLTTSAILMWIVGPIFERPFEIPQLQITWIAALWLGILGSGLAMIMMYYLIHEIGPTRASLVTYLFPVGGVLLGVIFLNEQLSWQLIAGTILIILSLVVVNYKKKTA